MLYSPDEGEGRSLAQLENLRIDPSTCDSEKLAAFGSRKANSRLVSLRPPSPEPVLPRAPGPSPPRGRDVPAPTWVSPRVCQSVSLSQKGKKGEAPPLQASMQTGVPCGSPDSNLHSNSPKTLVSKPPALPLGSVPPCSMALRWQSKRVHTPPALVTRGRLSSLIKSLEPLARPSLGVPPGAEKSWPRCAAAGPGGTHGQGALAL